MRSLFLTVRAVHHHKTGPPVRVSQEEALDARGELRQFVVGEGRGRCALEHSQDTCDPGVRTVVISVTNRQFDCGCKEKQRRRLQRVREAFDRCKCAWCT